MARLGGGGWKGSEFNIGEGKEGSASPIEFKGRERKGWRCLLSILGKGKGKMGCLD